MTRHQETIAPLTVKLRIHLAQTLGALDPTDRTGRCTHLPPNRICSRGGPVLDALLHNPGSVDQRVALLQRAVFACNSM